LALKRTATLFRKSNDGKKEFYIDDKNYDSIISFFERNKTHAKKLRIILELLLNKKPTRDLYSKESIDKNSNHVYALKPFKGRKNPRIYCQQITRDDKKVFVIVASELLEKKKSNKLTKKEKAIIARVASYHYILEDKR